MIFYDCSTAPSPRRARIFIAEKGLDIETREVGVTEGSRLESGFLSVNPWGTVPALTTDEGNTLSENVGIALYLESRFPNPPLMGTTPDEKGLILMWNAIVEQQFGTALAEALRNSSPRLVGRALPGPVDFEQIPALAERGRKRIDLFFERLETRLRESPYLAGDQFTLPDITAFVFAEFTRIVSMSIPQDSSATLEWYERVKSRPSCSV